MARTVQYIASGDSAREVPVEELSRLSRDAPSAVLLALPGPSVAAVVARLAALPGLIERHIAARQERRIEDMVDALLDVDPFDRVEAEIDIDNAALRARFLSEFEMLDSRAVHTRAGHKGGNAAQTASTWKRQGRILGLPHHGRTLYPAFQFDADGRPLPLLRKVLAALPADLTPWQRAFWLVAPLDLLDGAVPLDLVREGDARVVAAAGAAGALPLG